jgi:UDP-apiose/xylose synthase
MDFIPGVDGPSEGVPRVLACFSNVCVLLSFFFLAEDRYISFESMFSLLRRCMLPMVLQNLLRREPLKLVDGGQSQRTFVYIKDAIEAVVLMIVCYLPLSPTPCYSQIQWD